MELADIEGAEGFKISRCGKVFGPNGKRRRTYNHLGYVMVSIKRDGKKFSAEGLHRLLGIAFLPKPDDPNRTYINHIDLDPTNNDLSNLEWVTVKENNIHAAVFRTDLNRPLILGREEITGQHEHFNHVFDVADKMNTTAPEVWNSIKEGTVLNGWYFTHIAFDDPMPEELHRPRHLGLKRDPNGGRVKRAMRMKDLETGNVTVHESLFSIGILFKTNTSHVYQSVYSGEGPLKLFRKRYLIMDVDVPFPELTEGEILEARNRGKREVIAIHTVKRILEIYGSAVEFYHANKLSKKSVTDLLRKDVIREIDGWIFLYNTPENLQRLIELKGSPGP